MSSAPPAVSANAASRRFDGAEASRRGWGSTGKCCTRTVPDQGCARAYHGGMSSFGEQLREHVAMFFTNWRNPDYTVPQKLRLTVRNRALGLVHGGCCGNHGQPGC